MDRAFSDYLDAVELTNLYPGIERRRAADGASFIRRSPGVVLNDTDALREQLVSTVSGLLSFLGIEADPVRSREHILLSQILEHTWRDGQSLDLPGLIRAIQSPPFDKSRALSIWKRFFPAKDRTALGDAAEQLACVARFFAWMEGDPLDIQKLFYTAEKKPRLSIINIAHLNDY